MALAGSLHTSRLPAMVLLSCELPFWLGPGRHRGFCSSLCFWAPCHTPPRRRGSQPGPHSPRSGPRLSVSWGCLCLWPPRASIALATASPCFREPLLASGQLAVNAAAARGAPPFRGTAPFPPRPGVVRGVEHIEKTRIMACQPQGRSTRARPGAAHPHPTPGGFKPGYSHVR